MLSRAGSGIVGAYSALLFTLREKVLTAVLGSVRYCFGCFELVDTL
jgi:hypothetical protein